MDYSLTPEEKETVIRWSRADDTATVYASDSMTLTKVHKCAAADGSEWKLKDVEKYNGEVIAETWIVPKNLISLRAKTKRCELTPEQRKAIADRLQKHRINSSAKNHLQNNENRE